jgi:hypothetical protein
MVSIKALGVLTLEDLCRGRYRWVHDISQGNLHSAGDATPGPYWTTRVPVIAVGWMSQRKK